MSRTISWRTAGPVLVLLALASCGGKKEGGQSQPDAAPAATVAATAAEGAGAEGGAAKSGAAESGAAEGGPSGKAGLCADLDACREACKERRPAACLRMHRKARAGGKDGAGKAEMEVVSRLCDAGHAEACHVRHLQQQSERGKSAGALNRACDLGFGQSCASLADRTRDKTKAAELRARAAALLERNCQRDDLYACTALGHAARFPPDGEQADPARARWHYDKGCKLGDEEACYAMAQLIGGEQPKLELTLLQRACELGEPRGCAAIGDLYAGGERVARDMKRAAEAWQMACDSGAGEKEIYEACHSLVEALEDGSLPRDPERAKKLKKRGDELARESDAE
jgi:TPR repeat protein